MSMISLDGTLIYLYFVPFVNHADQRSVAKMSLWAGKGVMINLIYTHS